MTAGKNTGLIKSCTYNICAQRVFNFSNSCSARNGFRCGEVDGEYGDEKEESNTNSTSPPNNPGETTSTMQKWLKAEELYKEKKYFAAEKWYFDVVRIDPNHDRAFARLATIAMTQKRYYAAIDNFERALSIAPNTPTRQFNLALAYFLVGENKKLTSTSKSAKRLSRQRKLPPVRDKIKELP